MRPKYRYSCHADELMPGMVVCYGNSREEFTVKSTWPLDDGDFLITHEAGIDRIEAGNRVVWMIDL